MTKPFFVKEFRSTMDAVGDSLKGALAALIEHGWVDPDQTFYAQLCLEEALVNAVEHGNRCNARLKVRIEMSDEGDHCLIRVFDEGAGFVPAEVGVPDMDQMHGRGICLIKYCMEEVKYNRAQHCLEMRMRRKALCGGDPCHE